MGPGGVLFLKTWASVNSSRADAERMTARVGSKFGAELEQPRFDVTTKSGIRISVYRAQIRATLNNRV